MEENSTQAKIFCRDAPMDILALSVLSDDGMGAGAEVSFLPWSWFPGCFPPEISNWISILKVLMPVINYERRYSLKTINATDVVRAQTYTKHVWKIRSLNSFFFWVLLVFLVVELLTTGMQELPSHFTAQQPPDDDSTTTPGNSASLQASVTSALWKIWVSGQP